MLERDIKGSATRLIDCIATFSCNEICSYQSFIVYAILSNLLYLPRPQIKEKLLDGPEVLSIAIDIPEVVRSEIHYLLCWQLFMASPFTDLALFSDDCTLDEIDHCSL